jgi:hypothetical protein
LVRSPEKVHPRFPFHLLPEGSDRSNATSVTRLQAVEPDNGFTRRNRMKKLLLFTAILSLAFATPASSSPELVMPPAAMATPGSATQVAASDMRLRPVAGQPVSVQLVSIGDNRVAQPIGRQAADTRSPSAPAEGLPSTPIALATLLLLLCRLIGRRSS